MTNGHAIDALFAPFEPGKPNFLGGTRAPKDTRVVVAMSGGVDSSVTAAMLAEMGFDVVGITLQLYDHGVAVQKKGACCAGQDIHDARQVAETIGIPHYVLDYESRFRDQVMEDFADSYLRGETPIPCVRCNQTVKFKDLLQAARDLGAEFLATGHYIQSREGTSNIREMVRAVDDTRDQSYFLFATTQEQLDFLRFPLGGLKKTAVRELADRYNLPVADKPDSQDICFVPEGKYVSVIERLRPGASEPGNIIDLKGNILGQHEGIIHYTIGQRRGIGVGGQDEPLYVVAVNAKDKTVIVGPKEALATHAMLVKETNWLGNEIPTTGVPVMVKIRSTQPPVGARLQMGQGGMATVTFDAPEFGVSPGQAAVFYDDDRVLGGGWIAETARVVDRSAA